MTAPVYSAADALGQALVERARAWIGTPYQHQASCRGAGTDCLGLIRGLWREAYGEEPEAVPAYSADWADTEGAGMLVAAAARHLEPVPLGAFVAGDVALMRLQDGGAVRHVGVLAERDGHPSFIHAYSGHGVVESVLTPAWARRVVAAFRFPRRS
jgi:NlpC/P60 family putative phage cell wall peptidase